MITWLAILVICAFLAAGWIYWRFERRPSLVPTPFKDFPAQSLRVGDWEWRFHRSGKGPCLLLIHGIGANLFCWRWLVPLLKDQFDVIAIDLPGFGGSSMPPGATYGLDEQVDRVVDLLDALKVDRTFVVGNSMGGNIALWLTRLCPERVRACAVIAPATSPRLVPLPLERFGFLSRSLSRVLTRSAMAWAHRRTVSRKDRVDTDRIEETFRTYGGNHEAVRAFFSATEAIRDRRLPSALRDLKTKVLILWGSKDKLVSRVVIDDLKKVLPQAESRIHLGGGHHLQEDEPEWVADRLQEFFDV